MSATRGFVDTLSTVTRLVANEELMGQVREQGSGDSETLSPLAELIDDDKHQMLVAGEGEHRVRLRLGGGLQAGVRALQADGLE